MVGHLVQRVYIDFTVALLVFSNVDLKRELSDEAHRSKYKVYLGETNMYKDPKH